MKTGGQFCTFFLDDLYFGIDVQKVQEVIRYQDVTRVPLAAEVIHGLINLRGQIVTAIDLRRRLEMKQRPAGRLPLNVVVRTDEGATSLLVDEIGDVIQIADDSFEKPPQTLKGVARELILGAHKLKDRLLLILNAEKAVQLEAA